MPPLMHGFPLPNPQWLPDTHQSEAQAGAKDSVKMLCDLPDDALVLIFSRLAARDVGALACVCSAFSSALQSESETNRAAAQSRVMRAANVKSWEELCSAKHLRMRGRAGWGLNAALIMPRELLLLLPKRPPVAQPLSCQCFELKLARDETDGLFSGPLFSSGTQPAAKEALSNLDESQPRSDSCMVALGAVMMTRRMANLRTLRLSSNYIGDAGAAALARALAEPGAMPDLRILEIDNNRIGGRGAKALFRSFETSESLQTLETLTIYSNPMGDEGLIALGAALRAGGIPLLQYLNMRNCAFGGAGVAAFAAALQIGAMHENCDAAHDVEGAAGASSSAGGRRRRRSSVGARLAASFATAVSFAQGPSLCPVCGRDLQYRALSRCTHVRCGENEVSDEGLLALAAAISAGAIPLLKELSIGRLAQQLPEKHKLMRACHTRRCISLNGSHPPGSDAW